MPFSSTSAAAPDGFTRKTIRSLFQSLSIALTLALGSAAAQAYTVNTVGGSHLVRLHYGQKLLLAGNPNRPGGFNPALFREAVVNGLSQWKWATQGLFDFDYWQGTDSSKYPANLAQNGLSSVFFASNSTEASDPNVIGYTQLWYNANSGDIIEADILLNDRNYDLTTSITDTSANRSSGFGFRPKVYIGNILTHELGHALGLSHSGHLNSSMLYVEFPEQSKLGCDDWAGARHLYPVANSGTGALRGTIVSPSGEPVSGTSVTAISLARGIPIATALTNQSGQFEFTALEAGTYTLMAEKFTGSISSVPAQVQTKVSQNICGGNTYPTQFFDLGDGHQLQEFTVPNGSSADAGALRIQCSPVQYSLFRTTPVTASHFVVDQSQIGLTRAYRFQAHGAFRVSGIGHLLMSPVKVYLQAFDERGRILPTQSMSPLYRSSSQFQIEDTVLTGNAQGTVEIRATAASIPTSRFPAPSIWPNSTPFYVLTFNTDPNQPLASSLPDNARCAPPESLPAYQSPAGDPIRNIPNETSRDALGCSSAQASELHGPIHRDAGSILGRLLPFLLLGLGQLCFRFQASRLRA